MKRHSLSLSAAVLLCGALALVVAGGCDSDSDPTPATGQDAVGSTDTGGGGADVAITQCDASPDLTGVAFLVDSIIIATPANDALLQALNPLFATDIASGELIMLFHVTSWDATTGKAMVNVGNGLLESGNYVWDGATSELELNLDRCAFTMDTKSSLQLKPATVNKPIVVSSLLVDGGFTADGSSIPLANLDGAIKRSDATGLEVTLGSLAPVGLDELFDSFGIVEDADTDGDGTVDGWGLTGTISATAVTNINLN